MGQSWRNVLFAHWPVAPERIGPLLPPALRLETWGGTAWLSVTPFRVLALHPRLLPPFPALSRFCETNVRTYVTAGGKPGILFFTLDVDALLPAMGARIGFGLPYRRASVERRDDDGWVELRTTSTALDLRCRYRPASSARQAPPDSLDRFLLERYCLYTMRGSRLYRVEIHHRPWSFHPAARGTTVDAAVAGLGPLGPAALLHIAPRQDVVTWLARSVAGEPAGR